MYNSVVLTLKALFNLNLHPLYLEGVSYCRDYQIEVV